MTLFIMRETLHMFLYQVHEQCEKESVLLKQLDRLRLHLVSVEESYTQEALKAEEQVKDLQNKLALAEEKIKNSSTAYTSARYQSETKNNLQYVILQNSKMHVPVIIAFVLV